MIKDFPRIQDYLKHANIRLAEPVDNFIVYHYGQLNEDVRMVLKAYRHHFYEISLDISMGCSFQVDNFKFENEKGLLAIISPKRLQSIYKSDNIHRGEGFSLFFHPDFLSGNVNTRNLHLDFPFLKSTHSPVLKLNEKTLQEIVRLFQLIRYEYQEYGSETNQTLSNLVSALLYKAKQNYADSKVPLTAGSRELELASRFEKLVGERFIQLTTIKEYADQLNVSDKYLSQVVKQVTGRNALEILSSSRIHYAKSLLLHTELSPTQVSYELNFSNPNYFFTYFKKLTGQTPSAYKLENLKDSLTY